MELKDAVILVTGGGTGLGREIALTTAAAGASVAIGYSRSADEATETVSELTELGVHAAAFQADVAIAEENVRLVTDVIDTFGRLHVLVNNAGYTRSVPMHDLDAVTDEDWERTLAVNLKAPFDIARAAAPHLRATKGCVVNVSSMAGLDAIGSSLPYSVSKAGMIHLTRCLAVALAPDVRVNAVAPGFMRTRWTAAMADRADELAGSALLQRPVSVADVASAVLQLVTNDSITGQTLVVDSGVVLH